MQSDPKIVCKQLFVYTFTRNYYHTLIVCFFNADSSSKDITAPVSHIYSVIPIPSMMTCTGIYELKMLSR